VDEHPGLDAELGGGGLQTGLEKRRVEWLDPGKGLAQAPEPFQVLAREVLRDGRRVVIGQVGEVEAAVAGKLVKLRSLPLQVSSAALT